MKTWPNNILTAACDTLAFLHVLYMIALLRVKMRHFKVILSQYLVVTWNRTSKSFFSRLIIPVSNSICRWELILSSKQFWKTQSYNLSIVIMMESRSPLTPDKACSATERWFFTYDPTACTHFSPYPVITWAISLGCKLTIDLVSIALCVTVIIFFRHSARFARKFILRELASYFLGTILFFPTFTKQWKGINSSSSPS